jgi:predicted DCC family thiol-disulfide oxidoreductase YuxK
VKLDTMSAHVPDPCLVLLYDADCGLCVATTRWLAVRTPPPRLRPHALQAVAADPRVARAVRGRDLAGALHAVLPDGSVRTGAAAVLAAARLVPRWGILARLYDHRPGHALLGPAYRLLAANRARIGRAIGLPAACDAPVRGAQPG